MADANRERIRELRAKAAHAREKAAMIGNYLAAADIRSYAVSLEAEAARLESGLDPAVANPGTQTDKQSG